MICSDPASCLCSRAGPASASRLGGPAGAALRTHRLRLRAPPARGRDSSRCSGTQGLHGGHPDTRDTPLRRHPGHWPRRNHAVHPDLSLFGD